MRKMKTIAFADDLRNTLSCSIHIAMDCGIGGWMIYEMNCIWTVTWTISYCSVSPSR